MRTFFSLTLLFATAATPALSQGPPVEIGRIGTTWHFRSSAAADLWFFGLARIGLERPGPLALYDSTFVDSALAARARSGVGQTSLDAVGPDFLKELDKDSTLELVHFVPLYLLRADPMHLADAVAAEQPRRRARPRGEEQGERGGDDEGMPRMGLGGAFLGAAVQRGGSRKALEALARALQDEWTAYFGEWWEADSAARRARVDTAESIWRRRFAPDLGPWLSRFGLVGGFVLVSPALGPEGRLSEASQSGMPVNVAAVRLPPPGSDSLGVGYSLVKELSYSILDGLTPLDSVDPAVNEARSERAAVRAGDLLLQFAAPQFVTGYRRWFLAFAGRPDSVVTAAAFADAYPLDKKGLSQLRETIRGK